MENGDETFASPIAAAAEFEFDFGQALTNGGGLTAAPPAAKYYDGSEIDALRKAKHDLEEKLATASHENQFLTMETSRLELSVSQARKEIDAAEHAAIASESEAASLRAVVKQLQDLLAAEKSGRNAEMGKGADAGAELAILQREKAALVEEIKALKASAAAAAAGEKKETAAPSTVAREVAPHGVVAATAAGAAATAAIAVVFLHLRR